MPDFPFGYERIAPATWAYCSALLMLGLFFKFNRFWSVRNLDLVLLILLSPGLIVCTQAKTRLLQHRLEISLSAANAADTETVENATPPADGSEEDETTVSDETPQLTPLEIKLQRLQRWGYIWLFAIGGVFLLRLMLDPLLKRRPLLEPNLSLGGLTFLFCSLAIFIFADIFQNNPLPDELNGPRDAMRIVQRETNHVYHFDHYGPGLGVLHVLPVIPTFIASERSSGNVTAMDVEIEYVVVAKIVAGIVQTAIVFGLIFLGQQFFFNLHMGIGMAVVFLMLPSTVQYAGNAWHMLPAALMLWAIISYRRPLIAGILIGLATGVSYYPIFLLPLWFSFYWERGAARFGTGVGCALVAVIVSLVFTVDSAGDFFRQVQSMFGFLLPRLEGLEGIWSLGWDPWFRLPILVAYIVLSVSFVFWPAQKNLGMLIAYSAALMVAVQFWFGYEGGLFIAWYMPLTLVAFFRPNLDPYTAAGSPVVLRIERSPSVAVPARRRLSGLCPL